MHELQDVLRRYRLGHDGALGPLLASLRQEGERWLHRHALDLRAPDREDALQDALAAFSQSLPHFRGDSAGELQAYFRVVLRRKVIDLWRKNRSVRETPYPPVDERTDRGDEGSTGGGAKGLDEMESRGPSPEDLVEEHQERRRVSQLLKDTLSLQEFQVAKLKVEGFKDREIAEMLGIHIGTVGTLWHRARDKLRDRYSTVPTVKKDV